MKKRRHIGLWITLTVIVLLVAAPVVGAYALFYDASSPKFTGKDDFDSTSLLKRKLVDSLDDTKETGNLKFKITQDDLNEVLYLFWNNLNQEAKNFFKGADLKIKGTEYTFSAYLNAHFFDFKTKFSITGVLENQEDDFVFVLKEVKLGRLSGIESVGKQLLSRMISQEQIDSAIAETGFHIHVDLEKLGIRYNKNDMIEDIKMVIGKANNQSVSKPGDDLNPMSLVSNLLQKESVGFSFENEIDLDFSLAQAHTNANFLTPEKELPNVYQDAVQEEELKVKKLYQEGKIEYQNDINQDITNASCVLSFLEIGYDGLIESNKDYIRSLDLTSIGIADATTYPGKTHAPSYDVATEMTGALPGTFYVSENDLTHLMENVGIVGYSVVVPDQRGDDYKFANFVVDNFYVNVMNDTLVMSIGVSVGGYDTWFILENKHSAETIDDLPYGIRLDLVSAHMGELEMEETTKSFVFSLINFACSEKNVSWFSIDSSNGQVIIDFSKAVPDLNTILGGATLEISLAGETITDEGKMSVNLA